MSRQEEILDGLYDSRLSVRCFCSGNLSGAGTGQVVDRMSCYRSRSPGIRRLILATADAQEFYRKIGFSELAAPENFMEKLYHQPWFEPDEANG